MVSEKDQARAFQQQKELNDQANFNDRQAQSDLAQRRSLAWQDVRMASDERNHAKTSFGSLLPTADPQLVADRKANLEAAEQALKESRAAFDALSQQTSQMADPNNDKNQSAAIIQQMAQSAGVQPFQAEKVFNEATDQARNGNPLTIGNLQDIVKNAGGNDRLMTSLVNTLVHLGVKIEQTGQQQAMAQPTLTTQPATQAKPVRQSDGSYLINGTKYNYDRTKGGYVLAQ